MKIRAKNHFAHIATVDMVGANVEKTKVIKFMPFQESPEGLTHSCDHETMNKSGICDECLGGEKERTKPWWWDKDFEYLYGASFECTDFEKLCEKINTIVSEAEKRKVEDIRKMIQKELDDNFTPKEEWSKGRKDGLTFALSKL